MPDPAQVIMATLFLDVSLGYIGAPSSLPAGKAGIFTQHHLRLEASVD
jgi:hypothetical protein